jgi:hypothetical protein
MAAKNARANISIAETSAIIAKASKEDIAAMRTIAIESKRDSSAMKTISLLGMIFLPGTFVAVRPFPVFHLVSLRRIAGYLLDACIQLG